MDQKDNHLDPQGVVVGLSGGVDSAVTASLLIEAGYVVHGLALQTWRASEAAGNAAAEAAARRIADHLKIPLICRDVRDVFYERVIVPFIDTYVAGRTPNPCVFCNPTLKFAALLEEADAVGTRWIATGHYAQVTRDPADSSYHLLRARATAKDQSYALYRLTQPILRRLKLPLGDLENKDRVRTLARQRGLPCAEREDSQDLCFAAGTGYQALISDFRPEALRPGPILDEAGRVLGEHQGLPRYTIGQRSGLGIAAAERLYVLRLDTVQNALIVGPRKRLAQAECRIEQCTFIAGAPPAQAFEAHARIRYQAAPVPVSVTMLGQHTTPGMSAATVRFHTPQYAVTPGQSLVLYQGAEVLGGGVIVDEATETSRINTENPQGAR
jgi:tRNA-uridine 2-sulfurtransferase